jgi:hypothetical protein
LLIIAFFVVLSSYREKAKKDAAAVGNHVAKLLQSIGQVSCWAYHACDSSFPTGLRLARRVKRGRWHLLCTSEGALTCLPNEHACDNKAGVFLKAYINCTKGFHCEISIRAYNVL